MFPERSQQVHLAAVVLTTSDGMLFGVGGLTYLDLADDLARRLRRASAGSRVPSEHELAAAHDVSRPTARAALQELERRYLVRRVRGAGTFVHQRIDYVIGPDTPPSWSEAMLAAGHQPTSRIEKRRCHTAGSALRVRLEIPTDGIRRVTSLVRSTYLDGHASGLSTSHVPEDLAPDLSARLADTAGHRSARRRSKGGHVSLYHMLKDGYGLEPVRTWTTASLEIPPSDIAARIGLEAPEPTWFVQSVNRDRTTWRPVEHTQSWLRADMYRVVLELGAASSGPTTPGATQARPSPPDGESRQ